MDDAAVQPVEELFVRGDEIDVKNGLGALLHPEKWIRRYFRVSFGGFFELPILQLSSAL